MSQSAVITDRLQATKIPMWKRFFSPQNRYLSPLLITTVLLVGQLSYGILESYTRTLLAIVTSLLAELVLSRLYLGKWPNLSSAYISGISVGILVRSPAFWPYALCALISITSKYVLRVHDRHIWNPSNFGIVAVFILAAGSVAGLSIQWGNFVWPMIVIWTLGSAVIFRVKRFHISATYVLSFLGFALLRSWITGDPWRSEVAPITGPMYQLFIFFMITDPRTTVRSVRGQCVVAFAVAAAEMVLRLNHAVYAPFYALFLVGPTAMLLEMWMDSRRESLVVAHA
jgi:Na+-transporting NADH:ubiquinone oxidoreductase subunit NqrB